MQVCRLIEIEPSATPDSAPLRELLRRTTAAVHARMHLHPGFAAVQDRSIDRTDYTKLLLRLYGFYLPFETAADLAPVRSGWLASDIAALGAGKLLDAPVPRCRAIPRLECPQTLLGALYVIEGSALGGTGLARSLGGLLGEGNMAGRWFFSSGGADHGKQWRAFLGRLAAVPAEAAQRNNVVAGATAMFAVFEQWLDGWETIGHA